MKDETPHPEVVRCRDGEERGGDGGEWSEPTDTAHNGIEGKVKDEVCKEDGGDDQCCSLLKKHRDKSNDDPKRNPQKRHVCEVLMMERLLIVDEIKVQHVDVWQYARHKPYPQILLGVERLLDEAGEEISRGKMADEHIALLCHKNAPYASSTRVCVQ